MNSKLPNRIDSEMKPIQSKFISYLCLLMSNKFLDADKMYGHLKSEISTEFGNKSNMYNQLEASRIICLCGLGEMYSKVNDSDSLKLAENYFEEALKKGRGIEKKMLQFQGDLLD